MRAKGKSNGAPPHPSCVAGTTRRQCAVITESLQQGRAGVVSNAFDNDVERRSAPPSVASMPLPAFLATGEGGKPGPFGNSIRVFCGDVKMPCGARFRELTLLGWLCRLGPQARMHKIGRPKQWVCFSVPECCGLLVPIMKVSLHLTRNIFIRIWELAGSAWQ